MARSIVEILASRSGSDPESLVRAFARRYVADPAPGCGRGAHAVLAEISKGTPMIPCAATHLADSERAR
jgi:hypothetical protein